MSSASSAEDNDKNFLPPKGYPEYDTKLHLMVRLKVWISGGVSSIYFIDTTSSLTICGLIDILKLAFYRNMWNHNCV